MVGTAECGRPHRAQCPPALLSRRNTEEPRARRFPKARSHPQAPSIWQVSRSNRRHGHCRHRRTPKHLNMVGLLHLAAHRLGLAGEKLSPSPPPTLPKSTYVCVLICGPEVAVKQASHLPGTMLRDSAQVLCPSDLKRKHAPFFSRDRLCDPESASSRPSYTSPPHVWGI